MASLIVGFITYDLVCLLANKDDIGNATTKLDEYNADVNYVFSFETNGIETK